MITPAVAAETITAAIRLLPAERVPLADALDRVLAGDVSSPIDVPPWNSSAMDGYAARSADLAGAPATLQVIETIPAGTFPARTVGAGECARIFTGAPVPQGADTVIRQEDATADGGRVRINDLRDRGRNVRLRGEDISRGAVVLRAGEALTPARLGVMASIAQGEAEVHRRPRVAVLASGDEVVGLERRDEILAGRKIASSNSYTLRALLQRNGADVIDLGVAPDEPGEIRRRLERAREADLILTSAGVSVGEHDHMMAVLKEMGLDLKFWRIRMRPGAPLGFGLLGRVPWVGLPGNPVSTMVTFELFVRPAIRKMSGHRRLYHATVPVRAGEPISLGPRLRHYLRVTLTGETGGPVARLTGSQSSGVLTSMARADALLIVPEDRTDVREGEALQAIMLEGGPVSEAVTY